MVSPPMTYSINSTGNNTTINNTFSGILAIFLTTSNDILDFLRSELRAKFFLKAELKISSDVLHTGS